MQRVFSLSLICALGLVSPKVQAEETLRNDYVISSQNDTLYGKVKWNFLRETPEKISFIPRNENRPVVYYPNQIRGFRYLDDLYESKRLPSSDQGNDSIPDSLSVRERFALVYVKGKASLYGYVDGFRQKHFYLEADNQLNELVYGIAIVERNGVQVEKENNKYKGVLKYSLQDDPKLARDIDKISFTDVDLIWIVKKYNADVSPSDHQFISRVDREKTKISLGIIAGVSIPDIHFTSPTADFNYLTRPSFERSYEASMGVNIEYHFPMLRKRFSFYQELMYVPLKMTAITNTEDSYQKYYAKSVFDLSYLRFSNIVRVKLLRNRQSGFYLGVGPGVSFSLKKEYNTYIRKTTFGFVDEQNINDDENYKSWGIDFIGAAGYRFRRFTLEYRYDQMLDISELIALSAFPRTQYFLLQYSF